MNNLTYVAQDVPTLMTVLSAGNAATNPIIYGANSIPQVLKYNDVVEVVVNNFDTGGHPIHMHGHNFQLVARPPANTGTFPGKVNNPPAIPIRRDVIKTEALSYLVYRFKADNPGEQLLSLSHICSPCHRSPNATNVDNARCVGVSLSY